MRLAITDLFFSSLIVLFCSISLIRVRWLNTWLIIEIIAALIIYSIVSIKENLNFETVIKFFLNQSIAAIILLITMPLLLHHTFDIKIVLLVVCLLIYKIGLPPFHTWALQIIPFMNWVSLLNFFSLLKVPPIVLLIRLNQIERVRYLLITTIIFRLVLRILIALNTTQFRNVIFASSLASNQWILLAFLFSHSLGYMYLITYTFVVLRILWVFTTIKQTQIRTTFFKLNVFIVLLLILTRARIPPFRLFFAKVETVILLLYEAPIIIIIVLITLSSLTVVFYLNILLNLSWNQFKIISVIPYKYFSLIIIPTLPIVPILI